jgi:hypothetical protein
LGHIYLTRILCEAMLENGTPTFATNHTEVTFSCMKVFMLEHQNMDRLKVSHPQVVRVMKKHSVLERWAKLIKVLPFPLTLSMSPNGCFMLSVTGWDTDLILGFYSCPLATSERKGGEEKS